jgi:hypothetical protein
MTWITISNPWAATGVHHKPPYWDKVTWLQWYSMAQCLRHIEILLGRICQHSEAISQEPVGPVLKIDLSWEYCADNPGLLSEPLPEQSPKLFFLKTITHHYLGQEPA